MAPRNVLLAGTACVLLGSAASLAAPPNIQSDTPLIYLADNLDEKDLLGWCIDTEGRGFAENLHAHSCKPAGRGNDTQFTFDPEASQIRSVPYEGKCMALVRPEDPVRPFGLVDCAPGQSAQSFAFDSGTKEIWLASLPEQCVTIGGESASAGPYMSRRLLHAPCDQVNKVFKQWIVAD